MYWTDWGEPAAIVTASMDGTNDKPFVSNDIHWPNGLTIDFPNQRLYWTDAKKMSLESIRLDGTDRRVSFFKITFLPILEMITLATGLFVFNILIAFCSDRRFEF